MARCRYATSAFLRLDQDLGSHLHRVWHGASICLADADKCQSDEDEAAREHDVKCEGVYMGHSQSGDEGGYRFNRSKDRPAT